MTPEEMSKFLFDRYEGLIPQNTWGETSFFYNPGFKLSRGTYFVTIKEKDGDNDKASELDREGVFRINFGMAKKEFLETFGKLYARPAKGQIIDGDYNFTALDTLMPHPVYGWIYWVCVLNPSEKTLKEITPLIDSYYETTKKRFEKRVKG
jgi:hypothetical protein